MSKRKTEILRRKAMLLAGEISKKKSTLTGAGKKELALVNKHLRKALKAIERITPTTKRKTTPAKKRAPAPAKKKPSVVKSKAVARPQDPGED